MLRLRFRTDRTARSKNGTRPRRQTGVANASSSHGRTPARQAHRDRHSSRDDERAVNAAATRGAAHVGELGVRDGSALIVFGSSAIPQSGQLPGASRTTSDAWDMSTGPAGRGCHRHARGDPRLAQERARILREALAAASQQKTYVLPRARRGSRVRRHVHPADGILLHRSRTRLGSMPSRFSSSAVAFRRRRAAGASYQPGSA